MADDKSVQTEAKDKQLGKDAVRCRWLNGKSKGLMTTMGHARASFLQSAGRIEICDKRYKPAKAAK